MTEVRTEAGVIIPSSASVESVSKGGGGMQKGTVSWKIGPPPGLDENGGCPGRSPWGHPCTVKAPHDGMCVAVIDPERSVRILSDADE